MLNTDDDVLTLQESAELLPTCLTHHSKECDDAIPSIPVVNNFSRSLDFLTDEDGSFSKPQLASNDEMETKPSIYPIEKERAPEYGPVEESVNHLQSNSDCETMRERKVVIKADHQVSWCPDESKNVSQQCEEINVVKDVCPRVSTSDANYQELIGHGLDLDVISNQSRKIDLNADILSVTCEYVGITLGDIENEQEAEVTPQAMNVSSQEHDDIHLKATDQMAGHLSVTIKQCSQDSLEDSCPVLDFEPEEADVPSPSACKKQMILQDEGSVSLYDDLLQQFQPTCSTCAENGEGNSPDDDVMPRSEPAHCNVDLDMFVGLLNELHEDLNASASSHTVGIDEDSTAPPTLKDISSNESLQPKWSEDTKQDPDVDQDDKLGDKDDASSENGTVSEPVTQLNKDVPGLVSGELTPPSPCSDIGHEENSSQSPTPRSPETNDASGSPSVPDVLELDELPVDSTVEKDEEEDAISLVCDTEDLMATLEDVQESDSTKPVQQRSEYTCVCVFYGLPVHLSVCLYVCLSVSHFVTTSLRPQKSL